MALREAGYPEGLWALVKRMTSCNPALRPSLEDALAEFERLCAPAAGDEPEVAALRAEIVSDVIVCGCVLRCVYQLL
jgi:hypothetical protein